MYIGIILLASLLPASISLVFSVMVNQKNKVSKTMSDKNFAVIVPNIVMVIGAMCALMALIVMLCFTVLSEETPHFIFYVSFGVFLWLGTYLIVKTLTFKVIVKGEILTVHSAYRKPYSFAFSEITSAVRQVKDNNVKSERIVIKTTAGRKLIVERAEISYERFAKRIMTEVPHERLVGFEDIYRDKGTVL